MMIENMIIDYAHFLLLSLTVVSKCMANDK